MAFLQTVFKPFFANRVLSAAYPASATIFHIQTSDISTSQTQYAARKGKRIAATREKQRLARLRKAEQKLQPPKVWKPKKFLVDKKLNFVSKKFNDDDRRDFDEIVDNVYILDQYKERKLSFFDAMMAIRETHDPTMWGEPNAVLEAKVELDLRTKKKTKTVDKFRGVISYPNSFAYGIKRKVVAICKTPEDEELAKQAGAEIAGSSDLIQMIKAGEITMDNFDELVCHGDMFIELASIKSSVGRYFPTKQRGNIGFDMTRLVSHFVNGIEYYLVKDDIEPDYGYIALPFGRLSQTDDELRENFEVVLKTVDQNRPSGVSYDFITRVLVHSEPCPEKFPIAFWESIDNYDDPYADDDDDTESVKVAKKN